MNANINVTELACSLAERDLEDYTDEFKGGADSMYQTDEYGNVSYVDKAQDIFNELNDYWEEQIMKCQVINKIK